MAVSEKRPLSEVIFSMGDLRSFIAIDALLSKAVGNINPTFTTVSVSYPPDYRYWLSMIANNIPVTIKPYSEIGTYRGGIVNGNPDESPVAFEGPSGFEIIPNDLDNISLTYLRNPAVPCYDYCISNDDLPIFMPVGSYIRGSMVLYIFILYDINGNVLAKDVMKEGLMHITDTYASKTVELDWTDTMHESIALSILEKMGVNMRSPEIVQFTQSKEAKQ